MPFNAARFWPLLPLTINPIEIMKEQRKDRLNLLALPITWKIVLSFPTHAWIKKWASGLSVNCFFFYRRFVRRLFWQLERALESFAVVKGWPRGGYWSCCREDSREVAVVERCILWPFWENYCISLSPRSPSLGSSLDVSNVNVFLFTAILVRSYPDFHTHPFEHWVILISGKKRSPHPHVQKNLLF